MIGLCAVLLNSCAPQESAADKLKTISDNWWEFFQRENPENATSLGEYKYNDKLTDLSPEHVPQVRKEAAALLERLRALDPQSLSESGRLDRSLLIDTLDQQIAGIDLKTWEMPVDQFNGIQIGLPQIATFSPFDTVKHFEDYIARLNQMPAVLAQATDVLKLGIRDQLVPPAYLIAKTIPQCQIIIDAHGADNPLALPLKKFPESISAADKDRLSKAIIDAIDNRVRPAYGTFQKFLSATYQPAGRKDPGIWSLPGGDNLYLNAIRFWTTLKKTPEEIHQLGLAQVADTEAQIDALAKKSGYPDRKAFRNAILADPKYTAKSREQILDAYRHYIGQMEPKLPELFGRLPKNKLVVAPVPEFMEKDNSTQYIQGPADGSRPGQVWVDTYDPTHHSMLEDEATAYHEGVPGHHMQIAIALELPQHPFHHGLFFSAFAEGWALYAERLGKELGFYQDPGSDLGRLQSELFRAVRLVVDTGVHYKHWTRQQMMDFFTEHYGDPQETEVDRYIAWPAQALGYKLGQLEILDLRQRAQTALGPKFDIKSFHDEVLGAGYVPLDILETRIDAWIAKRK